MDVENTHFKHYGMVANIALSNILPIVLTLPSSSNAGKEPKGAYKICPRRLCMHAFLTFR